jgi:putative colanic acid biosynthesis acetyltransferase WcaF
MAFHGQHDPSHPDPLMRPMQGFSSKLRRFVFQIVWTLLCRFTPNPFHRWRCFVLRCFGARIGKNSFIYPSARIWAPWLLETGEVATIGSGVHVYNVGGIFIGHHAIVSEDVLLCGATHDFQHPDFPLLSRRIEIGPYAWICSRAVVLPGIRCGEGAVLGAAAVATRDLEDWTVYGGNPAKKLKPRDPAARPQLPATP